MSVKRELKRIYANDDAADPTAQHPMRTSGFALPDGSLSVFWMDWGRLIDGVFSLVKGLASMMGAMGGGDLPFDPAALPDVKILTQHMRPTFHYAMPVEGGVLHHHEASFGPETWVGLMGIGLAIDEMQSAGDEGPALELLEEEAPAEPDDGDQDQE
jgi:hypothetical protein